uniref:Uncharacterized protein n=1 Tax=Setaria italica TaxID=4555 RepID=K3Y3T0_SETIT
MLRYGKHLLHVRNGIHLKISKLKFQVLHFTMERYLTVPMSLLRAMMRRDFFIFIKQNL